MLVGGLFFPSFSTWLCFLINRLPLCLAILLEICVCLDRHLIMKVLYWFLMLYSYTCPGTSDAPRAANFCFLKGHAWAQKGFRCFDPSSRSRRPSFLPSMSTSSAIPPDFRPIGSASSGSSSPVVFPAPPVRGVRVRRVAALYWAASTCTSLF